MNPCISVIVPVYKVEEYLPECIDSILSQTFRDFELILVDDGSPDNCGRICDEYAARDARVRVIHQKNQGLAGARNAALDVAAGEYVTFIDSDDVVSGVYLERLLSVMEDDTDITVCKFRHFECTEELSIYDKNSVTYKSYNGESIAIAIFNGEISAGACGKLYRISVIGGTRFPVGKIHEDVAFTPIVCYATRKVVYFNDELYYYRKNHNSITGSSFRVKRYDVIWTIDYCIRYFTEQGETAVVKAAQINKRYSLATYAILAWRDKVTVPKEYRMSLLRAIISLRKLTSDDYFEYYLAQIHPKLAVAHEYLRKIKSLLPTGKRKKQ